MTDPELDAHIVAAARMQRDEIDRVTAELPDITDEITAAVASEGELVTVDELALLQSRTQNRARRSPWMAVAGVAAGVALIAVIVTATTRNVADSPAAPDPGLPNSVSASAVTSNASVTPSPVVDEPAVYPMPEITVLTSSPADPNQDLAQAARDQARAKLRPYFEQLVPLAGFVDGDFNLRDEVLTVLWENAVPDNALRVAKDAGAEGVSIEFATVGYSEKQMLDAPKPLNNALTASAIRGFGRVSDDFRSITIQTVKLAETPKLQQKVGRVAAPFVGSIPLTMLSSDLMYSNMMQEHGPVDEQPTADAFSRLALTAGFVDGRSDATANYILVYWDGPVSAEAQNAIDDATDAGVTVVVKPSTGPRIYDASDLENVCTVMMMELPSKGFDVTVYGPSNDLTGLEFGGPEISTSPEKQAEFRSLLEQMGYGSYPVTFVPAVLSPGKSKSAVQQRDEQQAAAVAERSDADPYWEMISKLYGFVDGGYGSGQPSLNIIWEGAITAELKTMIKEAAEDGVTVNINTVKYTEDEIFSVANPLVEELQKRGIEIYSIGPEGNYSGLRLGGPDLSYSKELQQEVLEIAEPYMGEMPLSFDDQSDVVQNMIDGVMPTGPMG